MLPVSLGCSYLIAPLVFSNVYLPGLHGEITEQRTHITSSIIWNVLLEQKPSGTGLHRGVGHGPDE